MAGVRKILYAVIAILLVCAAVGPRPASARGGYQICNRTSEKLFLAIAYYSANKDFFCIGRLVDPHPRSVHPGLSQQLVRRSPLLLCAERKQDSDLDGR